MEIDFDEASKIWMRNKKKIGNIIILIVITKDSLV